MNRRLLELHVGAVGLFLASIVVQVFLAGAAITQLGGSGTFASHIDFGYTWVGLAAFAVLVTAIVARAGRRAILVSLGLLLLYVVQTFLPALRESFPWASALHPVNALVLFALAAWYGWRAWQRVSAATAR